MPLSFLMTLDSSEQLDHPYSLQFPRPQYMKSKGTMKLCGQREPNDIPFLQIPK